ncbi:MAG: ribonuclease H-like domain-containing protein, partial [Polyangiaceae bacterium]|nr:ribonuclease H-like domain-containing protein [Polyangiaceae bacterium]
MSTFHSKLQRLSLATIGGSPPVAEAAPTRQPELRQTEHHQPEHHQPELRTSKLSPDRAKALEALKQQMDRIIAKTSPTKPAVTQETQQHSEKLPFEETQTPQGPRMVRFKSFGQEYCVGKYPIGTAKDSNPAMLSLLALDPSLAAVDMKRAVYLDTETTGLSGTGVLPFLIGMGGFEDDGRFVVEQLLLPRHGDEAPMMHRVLQRLEEASAIVTFNGKTFDVPLLRTRLVMNRMPQPHTIPHLDLLYLARRLHKNRIGACNLGCVESQVLGFERVDDVQSCEICNIYSHYLRTGDEHAMVSVVTHNT